MNCDNIQDRFLEMDNNSRVPFPVYIHLLFCSQCRRLVALLNEKFASLYDDAPFTMERDLCENIMKDVSRTEVGYGHHVGGLKWALVGLIILASMILFPFSDSFGWLRIHFGPGLELPVSIVFGVVLSIYASAGICSNLEALKKFIHNLPRKMN